MINTEYFYSLDELANFDISKLIIYFLIGSPDEFQELVMELQSVIYDTESIIHIHSDAPVLIQIENPDQLPALGAWSGCGTIIGFKDTDESVAEFVAYSRRFA